MAGAIALVGLLVGLLAERGVASPFVTASVWVVAEALRGRWPLGGFPWSDLGVTLHAVPAARAVAGVGGTLLVTFLIVASNGLVLDLALAARGRRPRPLALAAGGLVCLLAFGTIVDLTRFSPQVTGHLRVAMLQGDDEELPLAEQPDQRLTAKHLALASSLHGRYDLVVFPESALDTDPQTDRKLHRAITALATRDRTSVLVNARTPGTHGQVRNTNLLYEPDGKLQGVYSKQHLVPFGEYVPWRSVLGSLRELRQVPYDFQAGHRRRLFTVAGHRIGSVICFESAFGPLVRDDVRDGAEAIVVSTSNRSYRRSGNSEQHLALGQMRAAETARPVLQASLSGMSAVIDADGNVHDRTDLFESALVRATIATTSGQTLYVRYGDWIVALSALVLVGATIVAVTASVRRVRLS
jgi:apolipoprotein N-acyltransferase